MMWIARSSFPPNICVQIVEKSFRDKTFNCINGNGKACLNVVEKGETKQVNENWVINPKKLIVFRNQSAYFRVNATSKILILHQANFTYIILYTNFMRYIEFIFSICPLILKVLISSGFHAKKPHMHTIQSFNFN